MLIGNWRHCLSTLHDIISAFTIIGTIKRKGSASPLSLGSKHIIDLAPRQKAMVEKRTDSVVRCGERVRTLINTRRGRSCHGYRTSQQKIIMAWVRRARDS